MKFIIGLLIGLAVAIAIAFAAFKVAFGGITEIGDRDKSKDVTRTLELADFDQIEVAGVYELDVTVGEDFRVEVSGAPETLDRLEARVDGSTLVLDSPDRKPHKLKMRNHGVTAKVSLPTLVEVDGAGIVDGDIRGVKADRFEANISGIGELRISGECGTFDADVSGIGEIEAEDLQCERVNVDVSGVGEASVYASKAVDAEVSGIGEIVVSGSPAEVSRESGFLSRIEIK